MKKHLLLLLIPLLVGCSSNTSSSEVSSEPISSSESSSSSSSVAPREGYLDIYAVNDYHGRISFDEAQKNNGIAKVSAFLNVQKDKHPDEYIFLNAGDLWQDTYESEASKGKCLIESMIQMDCEAMAIGNHEFDWGLETIKENKALGDAGSFNLLGANIYNFDKNIKEATTHADDLCEEYKIIERNDVRIGIIGIIGSEQITSITSTIWEDIVFLDPLPIVESLSDKLRTKENCDAIILLAHSNISSLGKNFTNSITKISDISGNKYIDACLTGHSHTFENEMINGVPFVQSSYKGEAVSHIELHVGEQTTCTLHENLYVNIDESDQNIQQIVDKYINNEFILEKEKVVLNIEGLNTFSTTNSGRLQAYATYELLKNNHSIDVVLNNGGRDSITINKTHYLTNETLFNSCPFLNKTYVCKLSGRQIQYLIKVKACKYYCPTLTELEYEQLYDVACIDYVLLHKNSSRNYDYISDYDGNFSYIEETTPFDIIKSFCVKNPTIDKEFFSQSGFTAL